METPVPACSTALPVLELPGDPPRGSGGSASPVGRLWSRVYLCSPAWGCQPRTRWQPCQRWLRSRDGSKSFFASPSQVTSHFLASPSQVTSHFLASPSQVTSHLVRRQVKSSHKSFGPNTSQVTSLFVQVQVKSHIILSSGNTQSGPGIKSIYSELQSKIYEMVNSI